MFYNLNGLIMKIKKLSKSSFELMGAAPIAAAGCCCCCSCCCWTGSNEGKE